MKEFGSDFHFCSEYVTKEATNLFPFKNNMYANGRHAIQELLRANKWKRIWLPEFLCHDVIRAIQQTGIEIVFYHDNPLIEEKTVVNKINYKPDDVLFRVNYYGLSDFRCNKNISVQVIEDHTHDLTGNWPASSNADWCIASLRKVLPVPEGGILWSPKKHELPVKLNSTIENEKIAFTRLSAMLIKTQYLNNSFIHKDIYRNLFSSSESEFETLKSSGISNSTTWLLEHFNLSDWLAQKKRNWEILSQIETKKFKVLKPESIHNCNPFSLILSFKSETELEETKVKLIENNIYPAVLWKIPHTQSEHTNVHILSVHCDARYSTNDIMDLKSRLESIIC